MVKYLNILMLLVLAMMLNIYLSGCHSHRHQAHLYWTPKVPEVPGGRLPYPAQEIPINNEAHVQLPRKLKAYAVNRYIDPANPRIMHERHVMYRIEEDPRWKLTSGAKQQILVGNTYSGGTLNYNPALMRKELALELQRQRLTNASLATQSSMLIDTGLHLSEQCNIVKQQNEQLARELL